MNTSPPPAAFPRPRTAALLLVAAIVAAYLTSFGGTWVFDDLHSIVGNPDLGQSGGLDRVRLLPGDEAGTVGGRPVFYLTLVLNHALGGLDPRGYHAVNLAIHILAALTLFGIVRRTLLRLPRFAGSAASLALAIAALWGLHPLQTESVTYVVQRAESLCGLFYLLTLYGFIRSVDASQPSRWRFAAVAACLAGMGSKEVMASAPLIVLLYDRTFVAGSWREAWRQRGGLHGLLFATGFLLVLLVFGTAGRGDTAGFATAIGWWPYALTQCHAISHYLRLALWPQPLVFDYGTPLYPLAAVGPQAGLLLLLLGATVWALVRRPGLGFLGAWFFLILAPSSSIVPVVTQTMAEHRMYLPLAAVLALLVLGVHALGARRALPVWFALAVAAGGLTARRNLAYHSELALWADTVAHCPENTRARNNLGIALALAGRLPEAEAQFRESVRRKPGDAAAHLNLCSILGQQGRRAEAVSFGETAVRLDPNSAAAHINLADNLEQLGRAGEAVMHYEQGLRLEPRAPNVPAHLVALLYDLGNEAAARGDYAGAIGRYRRVLELAAEHIPARNNLANVLFMAGRQDEAIAHYREILRRNPDDRRAQENLARALEMRR